MGAVEVMLMSMSSMQMLEEQLGHWVLRAERPTLNLCWQSKHSTSLKCCWRMPCSRIFWKVLCSGGRTGSGRFLAGRRGVGSMRALRGGRMIGASGS